MEASSQLTREVARDEPACLLHLERRLDLGADLFGDRTAGMEAAGARRIHGRRDLPFQQDRPSRRFEVWIGYPDRALEYFGVRMYWFVANQVAPPDLPRVAEV